jgi:hypothetical protein
VDGILSGEDISEVISESGSELIRGGGLGTIWVGEVSNVVLPIPFDDGMVKEGCGFVTNNCPSFFYSLNMIGSFLGHQILVFFKQLLLQGMILLGGVQALLVKNLVFNLSKEITVPWFLPQFPKIWSQKLSFLREFTCS